MPEAFHRHPSWSAAQTLSRLAVKRASLADRVRQIEATLESLADELAVVRAFDVELARLSAVEQASLDRRTSQMAMRLSEPPEGVDAAGSARCDRRPVVIASAAVHAGSRRYDPQRRLFAPMKPSVPGSAEPVRLRASFDTGADGCADLIRMLEVPGVLHAAIMNEKAQLGPAPAIDVPPAVLGLPLSDAYLDSVFCVEAVEPLSDPVKVVSYVALICRGPV